MKRAHFCFALLAAALLNVHVATAQTPAITASPSATVCYGSQVTLTPPEDPQVAKYYWWNSNNLTKIEGITELIVTPTATADYFVERKTSDDAIVDTLKIRVTVLPKPLPTFTIFPGASICANEKVTIAVVEDFDEYKWMNGESGKSITLSSDACSNISVQCKKDGCWGDPTPVAITVNPLPTGEIVGEDKVCMGGSLTFTATGGTQWKWCGDAAHTGSSFVFSPTAVGDTTITCDISNGTCRSTASKKVTVYPAFDPTISGDLQVCAGTATATLSVSTEGATYDWRDASNTQVGTTRTITINNPTSQKYTVTVTKYGCTKTADGTLNVVDLPQFSVDNVTVCSGTPATLKAVLTPPADPSNYTFVWNDPSNTTGSTLSVTPSSTTTYSVTVTNNNTHCTSTKSAQVIVVTRPTNLQLTPSKTAVCVGETVVLTVENAPAGSVITTDKGSVSGNKVTLTATTTPKEVVTVTVTNGTCPYVLTQEISVLPKPTGSITGDLWFCPGGSTVLSAPAAPEGQTYTYLWSDGKTTNQTISVSTAGTYSVTVSNGVCSEPLPEVTVSERTPAKPTITLIPDKAQYCIGDEVQLKASNYGSIVSWTDGTNNLGASETCNVTLTKSGTYTLTVTDANGCTAQESKTLTVVTEPALNFVGDNTTCLEKSLTVTLNGAPAGSTFVWSESGTLSNGGATLTFTPTTAGNGSVTVTVTLPSGCTVSRTYNFKVADKPTGDITGDLSICSGKQATLTAPAGGSEYLWTPSSKTTQTITTDILYEGTYPYSVHVKYANGCEANFSKPVTVKPLPTGVIVAEKETICLGETVKLTAPEGCSAYVWNEGTSATNKLEHVPASAGTKHYEVTITKDGCSNKLVKDIEVKALPTPNITIPSTYCEGEPIVISVSGGTEYALNGGARQASGLFTVTPTHDSEVYNISVFNESGCEITEKRTVAKSKASPKPTIGGDLDICVGETTMLWIENGTIVEWVPGVSSSTYSLTPSAPGTITIDAKVKDVNGCSTTAKAELKVREKPTVTLSADNETVCKNNNRVVLTATAGCVQYEWRVGATLLATTVENTYTIYPTASAVYSVVGTNSEGCSSDAATRPIQVNEPSAVSISGPTTVCKGELVTLSAVGGTAWNWSNGLGTSSSVTFTADVLTEFYCDITDANGCTTHREYKITINTPETPTITGNLTVCYGGNTELFSSIAGDYEWKCDGAVVGSGASLKINNVTVDKDYTLTVTKNGCKASDTKRVKMVPLPTDADIEPSKSAICEGDAVTLTAKGAGTYKWTTPDANNGSTAASITVMPTEAAHDYTLTLTNANGCTQTVSKSITVNPKPTVSITGDTKVCKGNSITLTANGTGTFKWEDGTTGSTLTVTPDQSRDYTVTITSAGNCTNTATHHVEVVDVSKPVITGPSQVCEGDPVTLTVAGDAGCTFAWNGDLAGRTGPSSGEFIPTTTGSVTYSVTATNADGCSKTGDYTFTVSPRPTPTITVDKPTLCIGETAKITITGGTTYTCNGETNGTGIFYVTPTAAGNTPYNIVVIGEGGCKFETSTSIDVKALPEITVTGAEAPACANTTVTLTAHGGTGYEWSNHKTTQTIDVAVGTSDVSLWVKGKNESGCWCAEVPVTITVNPLPTPAITATKYDICAGESTTLKVTGGTNYTNCTWDDVSGNLPERTVTPITTTTYRVTVTDANGCKNDASVTITVHPKPVVTIEPQKANPICAEESVKLTAKVTEIDSEKPYSYLWSTGETTKEITVSSAGNYTVTVKSAYNCDGSDAYTVEVQTIDAKVSGDKQICKDVETILTASGGDSYSWHADATIVGATNTAQVTVKPTKSTTYYVDVFKGGCKETVDHEVTVPQPSEIIITGKTSVCVGEEFTLTATLDGGSSFLWVEDGVSGTAITTKIMTATSKTYNVTAKDKNGCTAKGSYTVTANALPVAEILGENSVCEGGSVTLSSKFEAARYEWYEGTALLGEGKNYTATPTKPTTYTLIIYNNAGCASATATHDVTMKPKPVATISASSEKVCAGATVTLTATPAGGSYKWSTGETTQIITPKVDNKTTYTVTVTVGGCESDEASKEIDIYPKQTVAISGLREFCEGESTTLTASDVPGATKYEWSNGALGKNITVNTAGDYTVTVTYGNDCTAMDKVTVTMNPKPNVTITSSTGVFSVCQDEEITLTASEGVNYLWTPGNFETRSIKVKPTTDTEYTVVVTNNKGCDGSSKQKVTVNPKPEIKVTGDNSACAGDDVTLQFSGADSYTVDGTPVAGATYTITNIQTTKTYVIVGRNNTTQCEGRAEHAITVNAKPDVTVAGTKEICAGGSTTLTASPSGEGYTYLWSNGSTERSATFNNLLTDKSFWVKVTKNGCTGEKSDEIKVYDTPNGKITSPDKPSLTICRGDKITLKAEGGSQYVWQNADVANPRNAEITVSPTTTTLYTVKVIGEGDCYYEAKETVTVLDLPVVNVTANKDKVCAGDDVTLSASGGNKWQWYKGASKIDGATSQNYTITGAEYGEWLYRVEVWNANDCSDTFEYKLNVSKRPAALITGDNVVCKGKSATLTASQGDSYYWSTGETTRSITVTPAADTDYWVKVKSGECDAQSDPWTVTVNPLPKPTIAIEGGNASICAGNTVVLKAPEGYKYYNWSNGMEGTTKSSISVSPTENTCYTVTVTDAAGCEGTSDAKCITVTHIAEPTITVLTGKTTVCAGDAVTLQCSSAYAYTWSSNVGLSQMNNQTVTVTPTAGNNTYTVKITDKAGCSSEGKDIVITALSRPLAYINGQSNGQSTVCKNGEVELHASSDIAGATFVWEDGSTGDVRRVKITGTATYKVWAISNDCKSTLPAEYKVTMSPTPTVSIIGPDAICSGESVTLRAEGGTTFLWQNMSGPERTNQEITVSPQQKTTYTCIITDAGGCSAEATKTVTVNPLPEPKIEGKLKICEDESTTLKATGGISYKWSGPGVNLTGPSITVAPTTTSSYTVEATNIHGCTESTFETVEVVQKPKAHIEGPSTICPGKEATLRVVSDDGRIYTCRWLDDNSTELTRNVTPSTTKTYNVEVTYDGCSTELSPHTITVQPIEKPIISGPTEICLGDKAILKVTNDPNPYVSYRWNTGATTQSIEVSPAEVQQHTYTVTATDGNGCVTDQTHNIVVKSLPQATITADKDVLCAYDAINHPGETNDITLTASGAGTGGSYKWYEDAQKQVPISGGTDGTLMFKNVPATRTVYVVAVSRFDCESPVEPYTINVSPWPQPKITSSNPNKKICAGGSLQLTATDPDPNVTFVWGDGTLGAVLQVTAKGGYSVTATNSSGCSTKAEITIEEEPLPKAEIIPNITGGHGVASGTSVRICSGTGVDLTAYPESDPSGTVYSYLWSNNSSSRTITVNPTATTTYSVTVTSASGCKSEAEITVEVDKFITAIEPAELQNGVCAGTKFSMTAVGSGLTDFEWYRDGVKLSDYDGQAVASDVLTVPAGKNYHEYTYYVKAIYDDHCETDTTFKIGVFADLSDLSINNISGDGAIDSVCVGQPKTLTVTSAGLFALGSDPQLHLTYVWQGDDITEDNGRSIVVTPPAMGTKTYRCDIKTISGCDTTVRINLKAIPLPELGVCADTIICKGDAARLYLTSKEYCPEGTVVTWTSSGGGGGSGDAITVNPAQTTTYTVTAKTPFGCELEPQKTVTVSVVDNKEFKVTATPASVCLDANGESDSEVVLTCDGLDPLGAPYTYAWRKQGDATVLEMHEQYTLTQHALTTNTTFVLTATSKQGCTAEALTTVTVIPKPKVTLTSSAAAVCEGESMQIEAVAFPENVTFEWTSDNGLTIVGADQRIATIYSTKSGEKTETGKLKVTNQAGCVEEITWKMVVHEKPKPEIISDKDEVCYGDKVELTVNVTGENLIYKWSDDDNVTDKKRTVENLTETTTFKVRVTNATTGCYEDAEKTIVVHPLPKLSISGSDRVCIGDSVLLTVTDANNPLSAEYRWSGGEYSWYDPASTNKIWAKPSAVGVTTYYVESTDAYSCVALPVPYDVTAFARPEARIEGKLDLCVGEGTTLKAVGGDRFEWHSGSQSQTYQTPVYSSVGDYPVSVIVSNGANCSDTARAIVRVHPLPKVQIKYDGSNTICQGTTISLEANILTEPDGNYDFVWIANNDTLPEVTAAISVTPSVTTTYKLVITNSATGCVSEAAIKEIVVVAKPQVTVVGSTGAAFASDTTICRGEEVTLVCTGNLTNLEFAWYKNEELQSETSSVYRDMPSADAKYHLVVTNAASHCVSEATSNVYNVKVTAVPQPTITIVGGGSDKICAGTSVTLRATEDMTHDGTKYSYEWKAGSRSLGNAQEITVTPQSTTTYVYTVTPRGSNCSLSAEQTIEVYDVPTVSLQTSLVAGKNYCAGEPITLTVVPSGTTNASDLNYQWKRNGEVLTGETSAVLTDRPEGAADKMNDTVYTYECEVINKESLCAAASASLTYAVTVSPLPQPTITIYDNDGNVVDPATQVCPNRHLRLQGTHLSGNLFEYIWSSQTDNDIADSAVPNEIEVTPATTTTYTLTIRNKRTNCERSTNITINVVPLPRIKIVSSAALQIDNTSLACVGAPDITLTVVAADGTPLDPVKYAFVWTREDNVDVSTNAFVDIETTGVSKHTYTVSVTNPAIPSCSVEATHAVEVMNAPVSTIDAYDADGTLLDAGKYVCAGEQVTLRAQSQPNITYEWRDNFGTVYAGKNTQEFVVNPQQTTTYTVKLTNLAGCTYEVSREVNVNPLPKVTVSGPLLFCLEEVGATFTLTATANTPAKNTEIIWTYEVNGAEQNFVGPTLEYAPQTVGDFTFTVIARQKLNDIVCDSKPTIHVVNVAGVPEVGLEDFKVVSSSNGEACINVPIEFEATAGFTKYVFGKTDGTIYTPVQESNLNTWNTTQATEGSWKYYCDFYNAAGCKMRVEKTVVVNPLPDAVTISASGANTYNVSASEITMCEGTTVTLEANATGNGNQYRWADTDGKTYEGKTIEVSPTHTVDYDLVVTNASGCQVRGKFKVKVIPMDKMTLTASKTAICVGATDNIQLTVKGSSASLYDWRSDKGEVRLNQPSNISIEAPTETVEWFVEASSSANTAETNCKSIASVKIEVLQLPDNTKGDLYVVDGTRVVCAGSQVTLEANQEHATTFRWSTGETKPRITVVIPGYQHDTVIEYWAIGRNSLGCEDVTDTMHIELYVKPQPNPTIISRTVCYEGETLRLETDDPSLLYCWYDEAGVELSRKHYCDIKQDVAGVYIYSYTATSAAGCSITANVVVTVVPFTASVMGLTYLCSGSSTQLWVDGCSLEQGYQFRWTYGGNVISTSDTIMVASLGTYYVEVTTPWLTSDNASFEVKLSETPSVKFETPSPLCEGDRYLTLRYAVTGGMPATYSLSFSQAALNAGFVNIADATMSNNYLAIDVPPTAAPGTYEVFISLANANGCVSNNYKVSFSIGRDLIEMVWDDVIICNNKEQEFVSYQWYRDGLRLTAATMQYYSETGGFTGEYYVVAYGANGSSVTSCVKTYDNKVRVSVAPNPLKRNHILRVAVPFSAEQMLGARMEVIDDIGRVLYAVDKVENENEVLVNYPPGVYMVRVLLPTGDVFTEKFVVQ